MGLLGGDSHCGRCSSSVVCEDEEEERQGDVKRELLCEIGGLIATTGLCLDDRICWLCWDGLRWCRWDEV